MKLILAFLLTIPSLSFGKSCEYRVQHSELDIPDKGTSFLIFESTSCGSCKLMKPILEKVSCKMENSVVFFNVNVESNPQATQRFQVKAYPTMLIFKNGKLEKTITGSIKQAELTKTLKSYL